MMIMEGGVGMAAYFAIQIEDGKLSYQKVFSIKMWQRYQDDVDAILIADGKQDMIVRQTA